MHRQPVHSKRVALCRAEAEVQAPTAAPVTKPQAAVWELDFCSRPILDERKKKVCGSEARVGTTTRGREGQREALGRAVAAGSLLSPAA